MTRIWEWIRGYWQYGALAFLAITALFVWLLAVRSPDGTQVAETQISAGGPSVSSFESMLRGTGSQAVADSSSVNKTGYVYISGAVKHAGLYHVGATTRWADVVQAAGGLTKDADPGQVNLAQIAHDQENMTIPVQGTTVSTTSGSGTATPTATSSGSGTATATTGAPINLNTATVTDLQTISGIGSKRAQDIIDYRDQHGGFTSVDELKEISGIGDKTFTDLQSAVMVAP